MSERKIIRLEATESTNSLALELGEKEAASGTVVVAECQTEGRGRMNRTWISPSGTGLYFSLILRPRLDPENISKVTLAAGLALCKAVEAECGVQPAIKWPNDLLLDGKKFGGILSETGPMQNVSDTQTALVVVGVGLNLQAPGNGFPPDIAQRTTSLAEHVSFMISAESLMLASVASIENEVLRLEQGEFGAILGEWSQRDAVYGKKMTWVTRQGQIVTGVSLGPDDNGMLRIRDRQGQIHTVISGDVNLVGKIEN
jgi:BirA family biotin operon repressor/biotin-[acetyl-CoA-carboxylase] ligase